MNYKSIKKREANQGSGGLGKNTKIFIREVSSQLSTEPCTYARPAIQRGILYILTLFCEAQSLSDIRNNVIHFSCF